MENTWRPLLPEGADPDVESSQEALFDTEPVTRDEAQQDKVEAEEVADKLEQLEAAPGWGRAREWATQSREAVATSWKATREGLKRHKTKLAVGAAAVSLAATVAYNPLGEVTEDLVEASPWVGAGLVASEGMFIGGLAMMASSVGRSARNPFKIRGQLTEICQKADDSLLFKSGFWVNTTGAVGSAAVIAGGILIKMPPESYGLLSFSAMDLAVTVAVRKAMMTGIKNRSAAKTEQTVQD